MVSQGVAGFRDIREIAAIFDQDRFGLNVRVGLWYFAAQMITSVTWMIMPLLRGWDVGANPLMYYVALMAVNGAEAATLVVILHRVREAGPLLAAVGALSAASGAAMRGVLRLLSFEGWTVGSVVDPLMLGSGFGYGAALMLGIVIAVRRWGTMPRSFIAGGAGGLAAHSAIFQTASVLASEGAGMAASAALIPMVASGVVSGGINGVIVGGLMYVGVAQHMARMGIPGAVVPEGQAGPAVAGAAAAAAAPAQTVQAASAAARQHYFVCCGSPAPIDASMGAYRVAVAAGWGQFRRLRADVHGGKFEDARRHAAEARTSFPGIEYMGEQNWGTSTLEKVLGQIRAAEADGSVHVAYGVTDSRRVEWMQTVYRRLSGEALQQGIPPFRLYLTESDDAAAALVEALEEA